MRHLALLALFFVGFDAQDKIARQLTPEGPQPR
jgi:hypothetical protein